MNNWFKYVWLLLLFSQNSAVQVKNVVYKNIQGTSATDVAVKFDCSKSYPCQAIVLQNINLQKEGDYTVKAVCNNVDVDQIGVVSPRCPWEWLGD